jgi:hypothetical protein
MPGTMWWIPHQGGIPCGVGFFGWYTRRSSPGRVRCRAEWHPRRTNTTRRTSNIPPFTPHSRIGRLLHVPPSCKLQRARTVPCVSTNSTDVGVFSTRCEHAQYPCPCSARPMRLLSVCVRASKVTPCGYPWYCMKVLGVPYPIVYSIHVITQSTVCEYQECPCECTCTRVVLEVTL